MKTKNKSFKTAAICGALAVLSLVNVCVLSFNKSQVNPILTRNVNADAGPIGFVLGYLAGEYSNNGNSNVAYYRYHTRKTNCSKLIISNGTISQDELRSSAFGLNASANGVLHSVVNVEGGASAKIQTNKQGGNSFSYSVEIDLPDNDWLVKTCESCGPNDEGVLTCKCVPYDECSQTVEMRVSAYKAALRLN